MKLLTFLRKLVETINPNEITRFWQVKGNNQKLYKLIKKGDSKAQIISTLGWSESQYYNQVSDLKGRLLNLLFFIPIKKTPIRQAWMDCHRDYGIVKILNAFQFRELGIEIAKRALDKSIEYEFSYLAFEFARELMKNVGLYIGKEKDFFHYKSLAITYQKVNQLEFFAETYLHEITQYFVKKRVASDEVITTLQEHINELLPHTSKISTYRFHLSLFYMRALEKELTHDNLGVLNVCDEALSFFEQKTFETPAGTRSVFLLRKVVPFFNLKKFDKALIVIEKVLEFEHQRGLNYGMALQYKTVIAFHQNDYRLAQKIINSTENVNDYFSEVWRIILAFLHFLIEVGEYQPNSNLPPFRLKKFLNETPEVSKDKKGLNSIIRILQILFLLTKGDKGRYEITDRYESLREYQRTYLKEDSRTKLFFQLLFELPKNNFRRMVVERRTKPILRKMQDIPINIAAQVGELEIVPYETIWRLVIKLI